MLGRWARKGLALLFMLIGSEFVSGVIAITPGIGSPQIDYPGFDHHWPFAAQLMIHWLVLGLGGALVAALAMAAWSDSPLARPRVTTLALVWVSWCALMAGVSLTSFLASGTMGPLGVAQPIYRISLTNGVVTATLITAAYGLVRILPKGPSARPKLLGVLIIWLLAPVALGLGAIVGIAVAYGMPWAEGLQWFAPILLIVGLPIALLNALRLGASSGGVA